MALHAQIFDALQKTKVTFVFGARRLMSLRSVQIVEVMQFLHRRHPEIGMRLELPIKPGSSGFLRPNAQEIGVCLPGAGILLMSVAVMDIQAISVALVMAAPLTRAADSRPNVLFLVADDLNHWIGSLQRNPQTKTPNLDRL